MPDRLSPRWRMMARSRWLRALACTAALACEDGISPPGAAPEQSASRSVPQPQELPECISIRSVQSAWQLGEATLQITRTAQGFVAGEQPVEPERIQALLRATAAPVEPALSPERLIPFIGDVRAELEGAKLPAPLAGRFAARALQLESLARILERVHAARVSDDYPSLAVDIEWPGGVSLSLKSESQHPLMLPWAVNGSSSTWNPDISRAVAALLPDPFLNRRRVAGEALTALVGWYARELFAEEIGAELAQARFPRELELLQRRFRIERGGVVGKFRLNTHSADEVWCGELFAEPNDGFGFSLCLSAGKQLASPAPFLRDADALLARAREAPWLRRYAADHPDAEILIEYRDDGSLGRYARSAILRQLARAADDPQSARVTETVLARSLGIRVRRGSETGTWILLPDQRGLFLYGKPLGAVEPQLPSERVIQADGSGGVSDAERQAATRSAREAAEFQARAQRIQDSVRSSFLKSEARPGSGRPSEDDLRKLSAPIDAAQRTTPPASSPARR